MLHRCICMMLSSVIMVRDAGDPDLQASIMAKAMPHIIDAAQSIDLPTDRPLQVRADDQKQQVQHHWPILQTTKPPMFQPRPMRGYGY